MWTKSREVLTILTQFFLKKVDKKEQLRKTDFFQAKANQTI